MNGDIWYLIKWNDMVYEHFLKDRELCHENKKSMVISYYLDMQMKNYYKSVWNKHELPKSCRKVMGWVLVKRFFQIFEEGALITKTLPTYNLKCWIFWMLREWIIWIVK